MKKYSKWIKDISTLLKAILYDLNINAQQISLYIFKYIYYVSIYFKYVYIILNIKEQIIKFILFLMQRCFLN